MHIEKLVDECERYGVNIEKQNGEPYSLTTIEKKLRLAKKKHQVGGAKNYSSETSNKKTTKNISPLLHESLVQAYFDKQNIKNPDGNSELPISIIMAVYGNHAELGKSGLSDLLPNVVDDQELKNYWNSKGVVQLTPHTLIPIRFIRI